MRLTRRIAILVVFPLVMMAGFAALAVTVAIADGSRAEHLSTLVGLGQRTAALAHALQEERAAAVARLVGPGPDPTVRAERFLCITGGRRPCSG